MNGLEWVQKQMWQNLILWRTHLAGKKIKNKAEYEPEITSFHKKERERVCFYASTSILKGWLKVYTELSCGLLCMNCQNYQQRQRDSERTALAGFEGIFGIFMKKRKKKHILDGTIVFFSLLDSCNFI